MSKRLQIVLQDQEYEEIRRAADSRHISVAEWTRQVLRLAIHAERGSVEKKLEAVRRAAQHEFPSSDLDAGFDRFPGVTRLS